MKVMEFVCVCPSCGWEQKYHSHKKDHEIKGARRVTCHRCGRSYKALDQRKSKGIESEKDRSDKPDGFFKYRGSNNDKEKSSKNRRTEQG